MEPLLVFLYSASASMAVFYMLYWLLLRKLTHFRANRFFLLASLLIALLIAAFPVRYEVIVPSADVFSLKVLASGPEAAGNATGGQLTGRASSTAVILAIYTGGVIIFLLRLIIQTSKLLLIILRTEAKRTGSCYLHENAGLTLPFSFFNHIFINSEFHRHNDLDDILTHENVHIREHHWIDLLFIELLTVLFWFNPFIWFFEHAIKQNHEYLADEGVLAQGRSLVRYQALLVNQLMGMQVIGLTNHLTFALGPNRLNMMNKQKTQQKKLLRMIWMIPAIAGLMTAFAAPEYNPADANMLTPDSPKKGQETISGTVTTESGKPLPGTSVVIRGTSTGTLTDEQGNFSLEIPETNSIEIVLSFVGYKTISAVIAPRKDQPWKFKMERATIGIDTKSMFLEREMPAPPPPPVSPPATPDQPSDAASGEETFIIVEEIPQYPGGHYALGQYVRKKQQELKNNNPELKGKAMAGFTINEKGEVTNIAIVEKTTVEAAEALTTIIAGMGNWSPGKQRGYAVPVDFEMELEF